MSARPVDSLLAAMERLQEAMEDYKCALEDVVSVPTSHSCEDQQDPLNELEATQ